MNEINIFLLTLIVFCYIQLFLPTYVYNWTPLRTIHILLKCLEKFQQFSTWSWWKRSLESVWFSKPPLWNLVKSIMWHCSQPMSRTNKLWHFFLPVNVKLADLQCIMWESRWRLVPQALFYIAKTGTPSKVPGDWTYFERHILHNETWFEEYYLISPHNVSIFISKNQTWSPSTDSGVKLT